jgi:hypothetical protein
MKYCCRIITVLAVLAFIDLCFPRKAYAYLDPGTGSLFFQVFLAALLAGLFTIKVFWRKIIAFIKNLFSRE